MKLWVLLLVAGLLLVIALWAERFEPNSTIRAPPYDDNEKRRIYMMLSNASKTTLLNRARAANPTMDPVRDAQRLGALAGGYVSPAVESFYTTVYRPATTTLTEATVDTFMASRTGPLKAIEKEAVMAYFITSASIASSGYLDILASMGQAYAAPPSPTGATGPTGGATGPVGGATGPTGPAGGPTGPAGGPTGPVGGPTGGAGTFMGTETTTGGSTTGYGTTTTPGRTHGVFGPAFTSLGEPAPYPSKDTSKTTSYPQLLGGRGEPTTTVAGAGVVSGGRGLFDDLPSLDSLGSAEQSQYFPFSRTPGDMERIPDPFRVAQTFDLSSLSSKTEPVPFLTDFSAFQK